MKRGLISNPWLHLYGNFMSLGRKLYLRIMTETGDKFTLINGPDKVVVTYHVAPAYFSFFRAILTTPRDWKGQGKEIRIKVSMIPKLLPFPIFRNHWFVNYFIPITHLPDLASFSAHPYMYTWKALYPQFFQNASLRCFLKIGWIWKPVSWNKKQQLTPAVMVYVFIYTVIYCSYPPLSNLLSCYSTQILKLLTNKYISSMGSCHTVDSYKSSVSKKYKTKMQV